LVIEEPIRPMLAAAGVLPAGSGWVFEFKYDGVRAITYAEPGAVRVFSRNALDVTRTYPELAEIADLLAGRRAVLDGEIVAVEAGDRPSFSRLQNRMHVATPTPTLLRAVPVQYFAFDLLRLDGSSTMDLPYHRRRQLLADLRLSGQSASTPPSFPDADGTAVLHAAQLGGFEGVVAKRATSPYRPGKRSSDWTKVPLIRTQEVLIIGYEPGQGRRAGTIGSLLLGVIDDTDTLRYAGQVGTGFTQAMLQHLHQQLQPLARATPAVLDVPREHARHAHWVEPVLVGEVQFRTWTPDRRLRHASWRGLRPDRSPAAAKRAPIPTPPPAVREEITGALATSDGSWRVEVVHRDGHQAYRILHGENTVDGLTLQDVQTMLHRAGVEISDLTEAAADPGAA
jgi:bifunctional non-homologous end joining protein LigD